MQQYRLANRGNVACFLYCTDQISAIILGIQFRSPENVAIYEIKMTAILYVSEN